METHTLLAAFGLPVAPALSADTLKEALVAAKRLGYPVSLKSNEPEQADGGAGAAGLRPPARRPNADPRMGSTSGRCREGAGVRR